MYVVSVGFSFGAKPGTLPDVLEDPPKSHLEVMENMTMKTYDSNARTIIDRLVADYNSFSEVEKSHLCYLMAGNPNTPPSLLDELSTHSSSHVRRRVAENINTSLVTLTLLSLDWHSDVRLGVVDNPAAPDSVLRRLAQDESLEVRYGLAENHNVPMEILKLLELADNPYISYRATCTIDRLNLEQCDQMKEISPPARTRTALPSVRRSARQPSARLCRAV